MALTTMKRLLCGLGGLAAAICVCGAASATTTLTYTGLDFTYAASPYTTSDSITGSMVLAAPLGDNFSGDVTPLSLSFTDGVQTITSTAGDFFFITNRIGQLTYWQVIVIAIHGTGYIVTEYSSKNNSGDSVNVGNIRAGNATAGAWSIPTSGIPEPQTWAMILIGVGITGAGLRISRRTSPAIATTT